METHGGDTGVSLEIPHAARDVGRTRGKRNRGVRNDMDTPRARCIHRLPRRSVQKTDTIEDLLVRVGVSLNASSRRRGHR